MFAVNFVVVLLLFALRISFACYEFPKGECAEKNLVAPETIFRSIIFYYLFPGLKLLMFLFQNKSIRVRILNVVLARDVCHPPTAKLPVVCVQTNVLRMEIILHLVRFVVLMELITTTFAS